MNLNSILSSLGSLALQLAPSIVPGAAPLIAAGKAISDAFISVKAANGGTAPPHAEEAHDALLAKVTAHATSTLDRLDG